MRGTVILSGTLLLFHNILVIAVKFKIDAKEVQVWEVKIPSQSQAYSQESYKLEEMDILSNNEIPFGSCRTFILLKKFHPRWSISYWLGKETTINHKKETAALAGKLWHQTINYPKTKLIEGLKSISVKTGLWYTTEIINNSFILTPTTKSEPITSILLLPLQPTDIIIPTINRETEDKESDFFIFHYKKYAQFKSGVKAMDLYEIKWEGTRVSISLIPLDSYKNEKENLYVLDKGDEIVHSASGKITNLGLTNTKNMLVYNLINEKLANQMMIQHTKIKDKDSINNHIETLGRVIQESASESNSSVDDENTAFSRSRSTRQVGESSRSIEDEMLAQMLALDIVENTEEEDESSSFIEDESQAFYNFIMEEEENQSSSTSENENPESSGNISMEEVTIKLFEYDRNDKVLIPLRVNNITEKNCYVLQNKSIKHYYMYIGTKSSLETITNVLITAEDAIDYEKWTKITFSTNAYLYTVDEDVKHPTVFWVNFNDYMDYFFKYVYPSNNLSDILMNSLK